MPTLKTLVCLAAALFACVSLQAEASYQPGDKIEYIAWGKWEPGVIESLLPGGKQYLVRRKPSEFFPQGDTAAYAPEQLRRPVAAAPTPAPAVLSPEPVHAKPAPAVRQTAAAKKTSRPAAVAAQGGGLLSKEEVIAYARQVMGDDPWGNPQREAALNQIRDHIKARGTSFAADSDFENRMNQQGTLSSHIKWAVDLHRGPAPKVSDYVGKWELTAANRGSHSYSTSGSTTTRTTTDSQARSGVLEIEADGTYVWKQGRNDPLAQWLRGMWREAKPEEMNPWEAGPAIWLEKAKQGYDCMVRMGRDPAWPGWMEVGMGPGRTPVEYGHRQ